MLREREPVGGGAVGAWRNRATVLPCELQLRLCFASHVRPRLLPRAPQLFIVSLLVRMPLEARRLRTALVAYAAGVAAELDWRWRCRGAPNGGSYARWRHLALPLFLCGDVALSRCGIVQQSLAVVAAEAGPAPAGLLGACYHLVVLILTSRFVTNAAVWMLGYSLT